MAKPCQSIRYRYVWNPLNEQYFVCAGTNLLKPGFSLCHIESNRDLGQGIRMGPAPVDKTSSDVDKVVLHGCVFARTCQHIGTTLLHNSSGKQNYLTLENEELQPYSTRYLWRSREENPRTFYHAASNCQYNGVARKMRSSSICSAIQCGFNLWKRFLKF